MTVGAYFTPLEGEGVLAFGGGIGTRSPEIRRRVAAGLAAWDIEVDARRNAQNALGWISKEGKRGVFVLRTNEEYIIAKEIGLLLSGLTRRRSRDRPR